jgi:hypothetical protein
MVNDSRGGKSAAIFITGRYRVGSRWLTEADVLSGADLLPGFSIPVAEIFAE